jgi:hypothetical protein
LIPDNLVNTYKMWNKLVFNFHWMKPVHFENLPVETSFLWIYRMKLVYFGGFTCWN